MDVCIKEDAGGDSVVGTGAVAGVAFGGIVGAGTDASTNAGSGVFGGAGSTNAGTTVCIDWSSNVIGGAGSTNAGN